MAKLETPQNVSLDGTVLSWDSVPGATAYNIYADNTLYATVADNNIMPVVFKQSTTAVRTSLDDITTYAIVPGTLYFTKDNYLIRDYIDSNGGYARSTIHGTPHSHQVSISRVTAGKVAVPSDFTVSYTTTSASLANGKTSGVSVASHSFYPSGDVTIATGVLSDGQSVNYTPAGIVSKPTFTGSTMTISHASHTHLASLNTSDKGVKSIEHAAHNHTVSGAVTSTWKGTAANIIAKGTVSTPTFTGTGVSYTPVGSVAVTQNAYTASVSGEVLTLTKASITGSFSGTAATITAQGSVSQPTFTGTAVSYTPAGAVTSSFSNGSTSSVIVDAHEVSIPDTITITATTVGAHSFTPEGTVSQPTFTGTGTRLIGTFSGDGITLDHDVTQGSVSGTVSYDKATNIAVKSSTNAAVTLTTLSETLTTSENS